MPNQPDTNEIGKKAGKTRADNHIAHVLGAPEAIHSLREEMRRLGLGTDAVSAKQDEIVESERQRLEGIRTLHLSLATLAEKVISALGIHTSIQEAKTNLQTLRGELQGKQEALQRLQQQANQRGALAEQSRTLEEETRNLETRIQQHQQEIADKKAKLEQLMQAIGGIEGKIEGALGIVMAPAEAGDVMKEVRQFIRSPDASSANNLLQKLRDAASKNRSPALQQAIMMAETAQGAHVQGQNTFDTSAIEQEKRQKEEVGARQQAALATARRNKEGADKAEGEIAPAQAAQQQLAEKIQGVEGKLQEHEKEQQLQRGALRGAIGYFLSDALHAELAKSIKEGTPTKADDLLTKILDILRKSGIPEGAVVTVTISAPISFTMPKEDKELSAPEKNALVATIQNQLAESGLSERTPHAEAFHPNDMRDHVTLAQREGSIPATWVGVKKDGSAQEWMVESPDDIGNIPFGDLRFLYQKRASDASAPPS